MDINIIIGPAKRKIRPSIQYIQEEGLDGKIGRRWGGGGVTRLQRLSRRIARDGRKFKKLRGIEGLKIKKTEEDWRKKRLRRLWNLRNIEKKKEKEKIEEEKRRERDYCRKIYSRLRRRRKIYCTADGVGGERYTVQEMA